MTYTFDPDAPEPDPDELAEFDEDDAEYLVELTDEELADAVAALYGDDPLAMYATPVTRRRKPCGIGRHVHDVLHTL